MAYTAYKFAQYVGFYVVGQPLTLKLDLGWSKAKARKGTELVIVPQTIRRELGMVHTPMSVTIQPNDERLEKVLARNSGTNAAHRAKFDEQAAQAKLNKQGRKLIQSIASILAAGVEV